MRLDQKWARLGKRIGQGIAVSGAPAKPQPQNVPRRKSQDSQHQQHATRRQRAAADRPCRILNDADKSLTAMGCIPMRDRHNGTEPDPDIGELLEALPVEPASGNAAKPSPSIQPPIWARVACGHGVRRIALP